MTTQVLKITPDGQIWADMPSNEENPCLNCGACCSHFRVSFYQGELKSLGGWVPDELTKSINPFFMAMKGTECGNKDCIALEKKASGQVGCSIYENRPSVCRSYLVWDENGNPNEKCQQLRKQKGIPLLQKIKVK